MHDQVGTVRVLGTDRVTSAFKDSSPATEASYLFLQLPQCRGKEGHFSEAFKDAFLVLGI